MERGFGAFGTAASRPGMNSLEGPMMEKWIDDRMDRLAAELSPSCCCSVSNVEGQADLPGQKAVVDVLEDLIGLLFPGCHGEGPLSGGDLAEGAVRGKNLCETAERAADIFQIFEKIQMVCVNIENQRHFREKAQKTVGILTGFRDKSAG